MADLGNLALELEYVEKVLQLAHKYNCHEIKVGDMHFALRPDPKPVREEGSVRSPIGALNMGPTDEELLYWSAGGPPPAQPLENNPPTPPLAKY